MYLCDIEPQMNHIKGGGSNDFLPQMFCLQSNHGANLYLRWNWITGAFQQLILPTTGKMSTHSNFKAIICTQNRCDRAIKVSFRLYCLFI